MGRKALSREAARAFAELRRHGLLLVTDARLPSLVALVAGRPLRGSWWGHPKGKTIYAAALELEDHPDVMTVKLVSGKVTYVHRRLWPALLAVAAARERWQTRELGAAARRLLDRVEKEGVLGADAVQGRRQQARVLEARLLVHAHSVHTDSGAHAMELESWRHWSERRRVKPAAGGGGRRLEDALRAMVTESGGAGRLPWQ